jgi:phage baseplate assembly protein gpV
VKRTLFAVAALVLAAAGSAIAQEAPQTYCNAYTSTCTTHYTNGTTFTYNNPFAHSTVNGSNGSMYPAAKSRSSNSAAGTNHFVLQTYTKPHANALTVNGSNEYMRTCYFNMYTNLTTCY